MKSPRKPLAPGSRIKFEGPVYFPAFPYEGKPDADRTSGWAHSCAGKVLSVMKNGETQVRVTSGNVAGRLVSISRRQVTHILRPKAKPEKRERLVQWCVFCPAPGPGLLAIRHEYSSEADARRNCSDLGKVIRLEEVREGEKVLSREDLAKAYEEALFMCESAESSPVFNTLCKHLGFPGGEK